MSHHSLENRSITTRPTLDQASYWYYQKPTIVTRGVYQGFSMPVYNSDNEELYYRSRVHFRWDEIGDVNVKFYCYLASAEDVGDKFKFQLQYQSIDGDATFPSTYETISTETTVVMGGSAQYSKYEVDFTIPAADLSPEDIFGARLRRVAASSSECTGEIVVVYVVMTYPVNKCFGVI